MIFSGIQIRFRSKDNEQYDSIGSFWDTMRQLHPAVPLFGVGHDWHNDSFNYNIGNLFSTTHFDMEAICQQYPDAIYADVILPDCDWEMYRCRIENLGKLYDFVYENGAPDYEIEEFDTEGNCILLIHRPCRRNHDGTIF